MSVVNFTIIHIVSVETFCSNLMLVLEEKSDGHKSLEFILCEPRLCNEFCASLSSRYFSEDETEL